MPVVDERGRLTGVLTIEDMMHLLARKFSFVTAVFEVQTPNI
jgi:CBS domain-containing protein